MKSPMERPSFAPKNHNPQNEAEESEEEDYMSMALPTPSTTIKPPKETTLQRSQRLRRLAEERGRVKSKAEKQAEEEAAREKALQTSLISELHDEEELKSNKGLAMMAKMGFKPGMALGKEGTEGRIEPIGVEMKGDKSGIGMDNEKKRRFREEVEREGKRVKAEEGEYRERVRAERENARLERLVGGAMRIVEKMDEEREEEESQKNPKDDEEHNDISKPATRTKPLKKINILYRGLIRRREEKDREKRMRNDLMQSLARNPTYEDTELDMDDKLALGKSSRALELREKGAKEMVAEEELEEEDEELDEFNKLEPGERLERLVEYLRREYWYCFWCKFRYGDEEMEGCPGVGEEDHD